MDWYPPLAIFMGFVYSTYTEHTQNIYGYQLDGNVQLVIV